MGKRSRIRTSKEERRLKLKRAEEAKRLEAEAAARKQRREELEREPEVAGLNALFADDA